MQCSRAGHIGRGERSGSTATLHSSVLFLSSKKVGGGGREGEEGKGYGAEQQRKG